jgi:Putative peptidoglycan binding domain
MADRDDGGEYDDWFDEPDPPQERRRRGQRRPPDENPLDDPWSFAEPEEDEPAPGRKPLVVGGREVSQTQLAIVVVSAIVLLLAVLAAAGVFSSGSSQAPPTLPPATSNPPTVTPTNTAPATTTPTTTVQAPSTTLKPGDTGAEVTTLQQALTSLGYSPGTPDGSYGPATKQAVIDFQTAQGLSADGVVGPKTLAALQQALASG